MKPTTFRYAMLAGLLLTAQPAYSDTLPWLKGNGGSASPAPSYAPESSAPHMRRHVEQQPSSQPSPMPSQPADRESDDRKLDRLATEFYNIHYKDKNSIKKMDALLARVTDFRKSLEANPETIHDIVKDAKHLEFRISRQLKQWKAKAKEEADSK